MKLMNLRSFGQVMFQSNLSSGRLFFLGIIVAALIDKKIEILITTLLSVVVGNLFSTILKTSNESKELGIYGYNCVLIGLAGSILFKPSLMMGLALMLASLVATWMTFLFVEKVSKKIRMPALTFPFVFVVWIIAFIVEVYFPEARNISGVGLMELDNNLLSGLLKNYSQVFLIENTIVGIIFLLATFTGSLKAGLYSLLFSILTLLGGYWLGVAPSILFKGLFGYNVILTAVALGSVYTISASSKYDKYKTFLWAILGVVITIAYQELLNYFSSLTGVPALTAPFIFAVWTVLFLRYCGQKIFKIE